MGEYSNGGACEYTTGVHVLSQGEERHGENGEEERVDARGKNGGTFRADDAATQRLCVEAGSAAAKRAAKPRSLS